MNKSKDHIDYWKEKIRKQKVNPEQWETSAKGRDWEAYIQHRGRREWFNLGTPNKDVAAAKAREVYRILRGAGWDVTLEKFKPEMFRALRQPTIGEFLDGVAKHASLRLHTFESYSSKLRCLAGEIRENSNPHAFDGMNMKGKRCAIDELNLTCLTLPSLQKWKLKRLRETSNSPVQQACARRTINSILRNARSLFTPKILKQLPFTLTQPLAISEVDFERVGKPRYKSRINTRALVTLAKVELLTADPEAYKIFLLALQLGLRRREIDGLQWKQFDLEKGLVRIETTEYTELKTAESDRELDVSSGLCIELSQLKESSFGDFVVAGTAPKKVYKSWDYRCNAPFERLIIWIRKTIPDLDKPIHTLRKEFGSIINASYGLHAARHALRHSSIAITSDYYLDKKDRVFFSLEPHAPAENMAK